MTISETQLIQFPQSRGKCPFNPPESLTSLAASSGMSQVNLWNDTKAWLATGHAEVQAVLTDARFSASPTKGLPPMSPRDSASPGNRAFIRMDDPEHNRIRRMVMREFRVQHVEARRSQIERFTHEHIDRMLAKGTEADLVSDFALPIPSLAIADLLGVADGDAELFQRCATVLIDLGSTPEEIGLVSSELFEFLDRLVIQKMESPGDDLVSRLATKYMASGELTHEEVVLSCFLLLVAGHETTANMIAMGTLALLEHPDQLEKFRTSTDPTMITNSIEELLRYLSIVSNGPVRVALEDVTIGGHLIRKGMGVIINLPTANRDPAAGAIPDVLDLERKDNKHIAFGAGTHQCLGMHLARLELAVTLPALFSRLQGLRLSVPLEDIPFRHQSLVFGAFSVPVTWDA